MTKLQLIEFKIILICRNISSKRGIESNYISFQDLSLIKASIKPNTKMVFFESLTNPTLRLNDVPNIVSIIKEINKNIIIAVDNTFLTPYCLRCLNHGVDVVMYSSSKYYNGHSDVVQGALVFKDKQIYEKCLPIATLLGGFASPQDCFLVERSIKTLTMRIPTHFRNSLIVAKFLEKHEAVEKVVHIGLLSHPDNEKAKKLLNGGCGVLIFYLKNGNLDKTEKFFNFL